MKPTTDESEIGRSRWRAGGAALVTVLLVSAILWLLLALPLPAAGPATEAIAQPGATGPAIMPGIAPATRPAAAPRVRVGLPQALERRASFTRAHRGPFAAALQGDESDSSAVAAGWHAGERVWFAWHQQGDRVIFAGFDKTGRVAAPAMLLGNGRWPRIAAEGQRVAVTWQKGDGFAVRVYDGKIWSAEIPLPGTEAAIALAPAGRPLFAATSTGLWRLAGGQFERVKEASYSQPAIALDAQGQPHVAAGKGGSVLYDDAPVGEGERPTVVIAPDGTAHVAFVSSDAPRHILVRSGKGGAWGEPRTIAAREPAWPALALGEGDQESPGVRLTWIGPAEQGPDALWLARLPETQPVLMPSLAGNVSDAWLLVRFQIKGESRWGYRPHDVLVSVNGDWLHWFRNTIPEGRYLFPLDLSTLTTSAGNPAFNHVQIDSWHMNGGHYITGTDYQIMTRSAWGETFAFAADEQDARQAADRTNLNHDKPDLVVLANGMDVPAEPPPSGKTDFRVVVANVGEADSRPAGLLMLHSPKDEHGGKPLARAEVPALRRGERWTGTMQLQGRLDRVTFKLQQGEPDFDPSNDSLTLALWSEAVAAKETNPVATVATAAEAAVTVIAARGTGVDFVVKSADGKEVARSVGAAAGATAPATRPAAVSVKPGKYVVEAAGFKVPLTVAPPQRKATAPKDLETAGERYAWLSQVNINPNNANMTLRATDGPFHRWYNSRSLYDGPLGFGWTFDYGARLGKTPEGVYTVQEITGFQSNYIRVIGEPPFYHGKVVLFPSSLKEENGRFVREVDADAYHRAFGRRVVREEFEPGGKLLAVRFADGTEHEVRYDGEVPRSVVEKGTDKAVFTFDPGPAGRIGAVTGPDGKTFKYTYKESRLTDVREADAPAGAAGALASYDYSAGLNLTRARVRDRGEARFSYNEQKDWITGMRAGGLEYSFKYEEESATRYATIATDNAGNQTRWDFDEKAGGGGLVTTVQYQDGKIESSAAR